MCSTRHPLGRAKTWAVSTLLAASVGTAALGYHLADASTQTVAASAAASSGTSSSSTGSSSSSSTGSTGSSSFGPTTAPGSSSGAAQAGTSGS